MSIVSAATFKTQVAAMATALTTAWKDSVQTELPKEISNPLHGLRRVEKFFNFNAKTGVVTSDDAYIDAVYAGDTPSKGNALNVITDHTLIFSTATVEAATSAVITLTFSEYVKATNVTVGGDAAPSKTIVSTVSSGYTVAITVNTAYINADTITVSGTFTGTDLRKQVVTLTDQAVTNNVGPSVLTMVVEDAAKNDLVVTFDETVTATNIGYAFRVDAGARALSAIAGSGTAELTFTISGGAIANGEVLDLSYDSGTGDTVNGDTTELVSFTQVAVTNNVV